jgi:hypothetical protein
MDILRLASDLGAQRRQHMISLEGEPGFVKLEFDFKDVPPYPRRRSAARISGGFPAAASWTPGVIPGHEIAQVKNLSRACSGGP